MTEHLDALPAACDAQAIIDTAQSAARPTVIPPGTVSGVIVPAGARHELVDAERFADHPRRPIATRRFYDAPSFMSYFERHDGSVGGATVWADAERAVIEAILDDHTPEAPGWAGHRAELVCRPSPAWRAWSARNGKIEGQREFAEHLEDRLPEIVEPDGATMLELAQSFHTTGGVSFRSDSRLTSGAVQFVYEQTVEARAGERGEIQVPSTFAIALPPFEGSDPYKVTARLRYRVREGKLSIGYVLDRPEDVWRDAFEAVLLVVSEGIASPVWRGTSGR